MLCYDNIAAKNAPFEYCVLCKFEHARIIFQKYMSKRGNWRVPIVVFSSLYIFSRSILVSPKFIGRMTASWCRIIIWFVTDGPRVEEAREDGVQFGGTSSISGMSK